MKRTLLSLVVLSVIAVLASAAPLNQTESKLIRQRLIPAPKMIELNDGPEVVLDKSLKFTLICAQDGEAAQKWVSKYFKEYFGFRPQIATGTAKGGAPLKAEGYHISAGQGALSIEAADAAGVRHAVFTLRQLAEPLRKTSRLAGYFIPECVIEDAPRMAFRGLHLCWFPETRITQIERYIRLAAYYKMNVVVLESWGMFKFSRHPEFAWKNSEMTPKNIKRLAKIANELGVALVPQINLLGHAAGARVISGKHATLDMHPELQPYFEPLGWTWCLSNPATLELHKAMALEMFEAFGRPPYFHVGCDEAYDKGSCLACRRCDYPALVADHLTAIRDLLAPRGCRLMMWHDMLLQRDDPRWKGYVTGGDSDMARLPELLPKDIVICDWYYGLPKKEEKPGETYPTLRHFHSQGFTTLACPWNKREGYEAQAGAVVEIGLEGMLSTTWNHLFGYSMRNIYTWSAQSMWGAPITVVQRLDFSRHLRQIGWDMPVREYEDTGLDDYQMPKHLDTMRTPSN